MFTNFYVADRSRAMEVGQGSIDPDLSLEGLSDFELIELSALLRDGTPHVPELGFADEEHGLVVVAAETDLVGALAALPAERLPAIASQWATAEGFDGLPEQDVHRMLSELWAVAVKANQDSLAVLYVTAM